MITCVVGANGGERHDPKEEDIDGEDLLVNMRTLVERRTEITLPVGSR